MAAAPIETSAGTTLPGAALDRLPQFREAMAFAQVSAWFRVAEDRGFEPLRAFTQHAFQACALGHYANPPPQRLPVPPARIETRRRSTGIGAAVDSAQPLVRRHLAQLPQGRKA